MRPALEGDSLTILVMDRRHQREGNVRVRNFLSDAEISAKMGPLSNRHPRQSRPRPLQESKEDAATDLNRPRILACKSFWRRLNGPAKMLNEGVASKDSRKSFLICVGLFGDKRLDGAGIASVGSWSVVPGG